jgi:hypothetical protein
MHYKFQVAKGSGKAIVAYMARNTFEKDESDGVLRSINQREIE